MATTQTLPRIVAFLGFNDSGEFGNAVCPHCGAIGRYVYEFTCEDGTTRGAMAGCLQRFPLSPLAKEHRAIMDRQRERTAQGRQLAGWDQAKLDAIEAVMAQTMTLDEALEVIRRQNNKRSDWLQRRGYGR